MRAFCSFVEEYLEERKKKFKKSVKKRVINELWCLKKFFLFLKEEKGMESFEESFFDEEMGETMKEFFESLKKGNQLGSGSEAKILRGVGMFLEFCLEKREGVREDEGRKENAKQLMTMVKNECNIHEREHTFERRKKKRRNQEKEESEEKRKKRAIVEKENRKKEERKEKEGGREYGDWFSFFISCNIGNESARKYEKEMKEKGFQVREWKEIEEDKFEEMGKGDKLKVKIKIRKLFL